MLTVNSFFIEDYYVGTWLVALTHSLACQDFVRVYSSNGSLIQSWTGSVLSGATVSSCDNMTVEFSSDVVVSYSGFNLSYVGMCTKVPACFAYD